MLKEIMLNTNMYYDAFKKDENTIALFNFNKTTYTPSSTAQTSVVDECGTTFEVLQTKLADSITFDKKYGVNLSSEQSDVKPGLRCSKVNSELTTLDGQITLECFIKPSETFRNNENKRFYVIGLSLEGDWANPSSSDRNFVLTLRPWTQGITVNFIRYGDPISYYEDRLIPNNAEWVHLACCIDRKSSSSKNVTHFCNGIKLSRLGTYSGTVQQISQSRLRFLSMPVNGGSWTYANGTTKGIRISKGIRYTSDFSNRVDLRNLRIID